MSQLTFKDLKKRVSLESAQQQSRLFGRLQNKPFWIWNAEQHNQGAHLGMLSLLFILSYLRTSA
jgi:hypothetical protein